MENRSSHILLVGMQNSIFTLENNLAVSHKAKYKCAIRPSNSTSRFLAYKNENISIQTIIYEYSKQYYTKETQTGKVPKCLPTSERKD